MATKRLGENTRLARVRRRLSQEGLAQACSITRKTLYTLEKGAPGATIGTALTVLWKLGLLSTTVALADPDADEHGKSFPGPSRRCPACRSRCEHSAHAPSKAPLRTAIAISNGPRWRPWTPSTCPRRCVLGSSPNSRAFRVRFETRARTPGDGASSRPRCKGLKQTSKKWSICSTGRATALASRASDETSRHLLHDDPSSARTSWRPLSRPP